MPRRKKQHEDPPVKMAYTLDYRGKHEDQLAFVFLTPDDRPLAAAFDLLCRGGIMKRCSVWHEHAIVWRNKKGYWRTVFMPQGYDEQFVSLEELRFFIEQMMRQKGHTISYYQQIDKFLNI